MTPDQIFPLLENYRKLVQRVDLHIEAVKKAFPDRIACKKGCDRCCRFLSLFPVEALSLSLAFIRRAKDIRAGVGHRMKTEKAGCPLLINGECVLYPARPIICRTHGYPLYMEKEGRVRIDFCPENFAGVDSFPKETMLDIDHLNTLLAVINRQFVESVEADPPFQDRIPVSDALFILRP